MRLNEAQDLFIDLVSQLMAQAKVLGYQRAYGEAWRPAYTAHYNATHGLGVEPSIHEDRLAVDLILRKNGNYLTDLESYRALGEFWKSLHPDCRWGGEFTHPRPDPDHFSLSWNGLS